MGHPERQRQSRQEGCLAITVIQTPVCSAGRRDDDPFRQSLARFLAHTLTCNFRYTSTAIWHPKALFRGLAKNRGRFSRPCACRISQRPCATIKRNLLKS